MAKGGGDVCEEEPKTANSEVGLVGESWVSYQMEWGGSHQQMRRPRGFSPW
jgi:hypothetical protein